MESTATATTPSARAAKRIRQAAYWLAPSLFCMLLYWRAFGTWFQADDFNWLRIAAAVHSNRELVYALFAPMAQGTVRVLGENVFYVALFRLFGMNPLPFHLVTFGTQLANLVLLAAITRRISGEAPFIYSFALPPDLLSHASVVVSLEVDRTFRVPPDDHHLGLAFSAFEIR